MALANDLLEQAHHLAKRERQRPRQASLRRAVSAAYYALFHLLISEATRHWKLAHQRPTLSRLFAHSKMLDASNKQRGQCKDYFKTTPPPAPGPDFNCMTHLQGISFTFSQVQQRRHEADYDIAKKWTRIEAMQIIDEVEGAFQNWQLIRDHKFAQAYLLSLLGQPRGN